jgi:hypothetical protein
VEAIAFGAAGLLFGSSIQRARAQRAEGDADAARTEAQRHLSDAANGRALAAAIEADAPPDAAEEGQFERLGPAGAASDSAAVARRHANAARRGPERPARSDRRRGIRQPGDLWRADPDAQLHAPGRGRAALQPVPRHGPVLSDAGGAADQGPGRALPDRAPGLASRPTPPRILRTAPPPPTRLPRRIPPAIPTPPLDRHQRTSPLDSTGL